VNNAWSFDIIRQSAWDVWTWICIAATLALLSYAVLGRLWLRGPRGWVELGLIAVGVVGTAAVLGLPDLRSAHAGFFWTFGVLALLSATFYLELLPRLGGRRMGTLLAMRIIALALLIPMLFEPVIRRVTQPKPDRPLLMVVDTSGSMSFPDVQNGPTRIQSVVQTLRSQLGKINENFVPKYYTFSTGLDPLPGPDALSTAKADGKATDIAGAINKLLSENTRSDAAVILISDGIDNVSPDVLDALAANDHPINTVRVGSEQTNPSNLVNVAVADVVADDDFVVGHDAPIKALIKSTALPNRVVDVKMAEVDADGKPISQINAQKLVLQPTPDGQEVTFNYNAPAVGVHRLSVWVDPVPGERNLLDNRQEFQGLAIDPRVKVLYLEGRVRPEYRELYRTLGHDPNIELATMLRIQQDRFFAGGSVDGAAFTWQQLPADPAAWKKFDVIMLGDIDVSFLQGPAMDAIEQAVSGGGALIMLGGQNSFGPGGYKDTPIERALPVMVGDLNSPQEKQEFVPRLTADGLVHPTMQGLSDWFGTGNKPGTKDLPPLRGNVVVAGAKSGAQVLLTHPDRLGPDGKPQIVLAVERYGKGRSAAFTVDTTYLWSLPLYGMGQDSPYNRLWGQLIRWLAGTDVRNRERGAGLEGLLNKNNYQLGENVHIRAMVRDEHGDATRYAQVSVKLQHVGEVAQQSLSLNPVDSHLGMYDLVIPHPDRGDWVMNLIASKDGKLLGTERLKFTVIPPDDEMLKLAANPKLLAAIAAATHGSSYELAGLPTLLDSLTKGMPKEQQQSVPLYNVLAAALTLTGHTPPWPPTANLPIEGLLVFALLAAEWILRRRWQLT
jgi:uncharacterized membrane protein